ncbi:MAG: EAL and HDOD domain-containing protein [Acidimicrobiia bacterium]
MARVSAARSSTINEEPDHTVVTPAVVARQAIYDSRLRHVAYELLFRPMSDAGVQLGDADAATAQVLLTAFSDVGLDNLVGVHRAFVNVPYAFLTAGLCCALPTDRVVLEILENVQVDRDVVEVARGLVAAGHTLALDDFVFQDGMEDLVELADIVKLDVLALSPRELGRQVELLRPYGVTLLAEKIEAAGSIDELRAMGFEYFQGFALQRPVTVHARATGVNKAVLVQILSGLHDPNVTAADLVDTVGRDPSIAYALLRILNSAHLSLERKVSSLHQALVLLGVDGLRNWTTMMVMSRLACDSQETFSAALIRAKMCELCATGPGADGAVAFTAGLLSALPGLLERPLADVVDELALAPELRSALLDGQGPVGQVLGWVLGYEAQDRELLVELGAPPLIAHAFIDAVQWSRTFAGGLSHSRH